MEIINSKKGAPDFIVLMIVGSFMIFIILMMNVAVSQLIGGDVSPSEYQDVYLNEIVKFLRTPANFIDERYVGMNLAEYIAYVYDNEEEFAEEFIDYASSFASAFCTNYPANNPRCFFTITDLSCVSSGRGREISSLDESIEVTRTRTQDGAQAELSLLERCRHKVPNLSPQNTITSFRFYGPNNKIYEIKLESTVRP
ncbi:MAG: hypothetical protein ACOCUR_00415 [Nanoarchaeota archaeon]